MKRFSIFLLIAAAAMQAFAQNTFPSTGAVGIGTTLPSSSSLLEVKSTTKGVLISRMTKTQRDAIISPVEGLLIYQTTNSPGFYYYDGSVWSAVSPKSANKTLGNLSAPTAINANLLPGSNNTLDLGSAAVSWKDIYVDGSIYLSDTKFISGSGAGTFVGYNAGFSNTGALNSGFGSYAMHSNTTGISNSGFGSYALYYNTTGHDNTASGAYSLYLNTTGFENTADGNFSLTNNTTGQSNTAFGFASLSSNQTGNANTANGWKALNSNVIGFANTAHGAEALFNSLGSENTASGYAALYTNTWGNQNVGVGVAALFSNDVGSWNSAVGYGALVDNTTGDGNMAAGFNALDANTTGSYNTAAGLEAGSYNDANTYCSYFGTYADQAVSTDFTNATALGYSSRITASHQIRIGNSSVTSIGGYQGWSNISDGRYKKNVKENVPGLEFISLLKPITYTLDVNGISNFLGEDVKGEGKTDSKGHTLRNEESEDARRLRQQGRDEKSKIVYTGFIAQDVEAAAEKLGYDFSGIDKPQNDHSLYGLRYAEFVVPLVKSVQELSQKNDEKNSKINDQQKQIDSLYSKIEQMQSDIDISRSERSQSDREMTDGFAKLTIDNRQPVTLLGQNIPNPFDNSTLIPFRIPKDCKDASIMITSTSTSEVFSLIPISCNEDHITIDAGTLASGMYAYTLYVDGKIIDTKLMEIIR